MTPPIRSRISKKSPPQKKPNLPLPRSLKANLSVIELGDHVVADPGICHGKPTFKGTRILVQQVLEDVADGKSWDFISQVRWGGRLPVAAIAEAVRLAQSALLDNQGSLLRKPRASRAKALVPA